VYLSKRGSNDALLFYVTGTHFLFRVPLGGRMVKVGFFSEHARVEFVVTVDFSRGVAAARDSVSVDVAMNSISSVDLRSDVLELARTSPADWSFFNTLITKIDLYVKEIDKRMAKKARKS